MENEARGVCACGAVITVTVWLDRVDKYRSERRNVVVEPLLTSDERRPRLGVQADVELDHKHALAVQSRRRRPAAQRHMLRSRMAALARALGCPDGTQRARDASWRDSRVRTREIAYF